MDWPLCIFRIENYPWKGFLRSISGNLHTAGCSIGLVCTYFSTPIIAAFYAWAAQSDFYFQFWTSGHVCGVLSPLMFLFSAKKFDTTFILVFALKHVFTLLSSKMKTLCSMYRHSSISAIFDLQWFIILSYFPSL